MVGEHTSLLIRPIEPSDRPALAAGLARMSPESRYRRFLSPTKNLTENELRYLTEVDHYDHEALVAVELGSTEGIGVARYVRLEDRPEVAELAVAVTDDRQGQGVGSLLLQRLAAVARENGIRRFSALILEENRPMLSLLNELGDATVTGHEAGAVNLEVELPEQGLGSALRALLRATARGELVPRPLRLTRRLGPPE
jgi:GNAT superfamily N-acetyltransferase